MSGYTGKAVIPIDAGMNGNAFLQKPFTQTTLACKVLKVLDRIPKAPI